MKIKSVSINNKNSSNEPVIDVSKPGNSVGNEKSTNESIIQLQDTNYTAKIRYRVFWSKKIVLSSTSRNCMMAPRVHGRLRPKRPISRT